MRTNYQQSTVLRFNDDVYTTSSSGKMIVEKKYDRVNQPDSVHPSGYHRRSLRLPPIAPNRCAHRRYRIVRRQQLRSKATPGWPVKTSAGLSTSWGAASGHSISLPGIPATLATSGLTRLRGYFQVSRGSVN